MPALPAQQWTFETPLSPPSLLKFREGHRAPPCLIRYYGDDGKAILTAGVDRALRMTSVVRDSRSREISQGKSPLLSSRPDPVRATHPPHGGALPRASCGIPTSQHT